MSSVTDISVESGIGKLNSIVSFSTLLRLCLNLLGSVQTGSICAFLAHVQSGTTSNIFDFRTNQNYMYLFDPRVYRNSVCLFYLPLNKAEIYLFFILLQTGTMRAFFFLFFFLLTLVQTRTLCTFLIMCKPGLYMPFCFFVSLVQTGSMRAFYFESCTKRKYM